MRLIQSHKPHKPNKLLGSRQRNRNFACGLAAISLAIGSFQLRADHHEEFEKVPLEEATILQIQSAMDAGTLTAEALVEMYLKRIEAYDQKGPALNSMRYINPKALEVARALDCERKEKGPRSLLHGIPILPKDNYDTYDMPTTGGSKSLEGSYPLYDAFTIRRLREQGAIILGKTNLDEFNSGSSGTSGLGGQVKNPYNLNKSPGGSSAGSGAAIAAVFGQVGLGTETGSSIRNPSTKNNLVGIASTTGMVSRYGILPSSILLDRAGPMARNVTDAVIVFHGMAGMDVGDLITVQGLGHLPEEGYLDHLDPDGLKNARIGVLRDNFGKDPEDEEGLAVIEKALEALDEAGAILIDPAPTGLDFFTILKDLRTGGAERKEAMDLYLKNRGPDAPVKSMADIDASGLALGKLQKRIKESLDSGPMYFDEDYIAFIRNRKAFQDMLLDLYEKYDLDALVYPYQTKLEYTLDVAAPEGGAVEGASNYSTLGRGTRISTTSGFPGFTIPAGFTESDGMPIGLEFLGKPYTEAKLIELTYAFEQATQHRRLPDTTPSLGEFILVPAE